MAGLKDIAILIPGQLNPHAVERVAEAFELHRIETGDPALLAPGLRERIRGVASMAPVNAALIDALPNLEIIANYGVGYDAIDARHAAAKGVMVTNTPDVLTEEVADTTIGLLINTVRELPQAETWLREGRWQRDGNYRLTPGSLRGRSVGIFGMGRIGQAVARRIEAFGLLVSYHNRRPVEGSPYRYYPTLVGMADAVDTLICVAPGGAATENAINAEVLDALGPNGVFINIGRGSTVDDKALAAALRNRTILAAGLDVFRAEPNVPAEYLTLDNISLLPHVGSASLATRDAMADLMADNLVAWFSQGRPLTPVPETVHLTR